MNVWVKTAVVIGKAIVSVLLIALFAVTVTGVSPIYRFKAPEPFSGPDVFNPYRNLDTSGCWKRANFHTHTRVDGFLNECQYSPQETYDAYKKLGYDIVTFSNHNELTAHPFDQSLQVNVYEHGYNLFKYHKLVFGCHDEHMFDHLVPALASQKQFQIDFLKKESDFIQMNHPLRTIGTSKSHMEKIGGYQIMELDSGKSTENEYWDWALSAGHYSFALANDDLHYPDRSRCIAVRCNFLCCDSASYEDIRQTLLDGCFYSMRIPDYGRGDWEIKYSENRKLPYIKDIGADGDSIYIRLSAAADSIKVTGQDHKTLAIEMQTDRLGYRIKETDSYGRFTAYFPEGEVIWSNPFARYDASSTENPVLTADTHTVDIVRTILFNLLLMAVASGLVICIYKLWKRK